MHWAGRQLSFSSAPCCSIPRNRGAGRTRTRNYGSLLLEANALLATATALQQAPDDVTAITERLVILANTGAFDEARELVERRLRAEPNLTWERGIRAFVLLYQRQYGDALTEVERALEKTPTEIWLHDIKALCLRGAGRETEAMAEFAWLSGSI